MSDRKIVQTNDAQFTKSGMYAMGMNAYEIRSTKGQKPAPAIWTWRRSALIFAGNVDRPSPCAHAAAKKTTVASSAPGVPSDLLRSESQSWCFPQSFS